MASAEEFVVTPKNTKKAKKVVIRVKASIQMAAMKFFGRLVTLDWCKCSYCTAATLNHPRACLCCKETAEALALTDGNSEPITCIIHHYNFRAVCLNRTVLKTILVRTKHLVQGMDFSASELPNEYVLSKITLIYLFFSCDLSVYLLKYILTVLHQVYLFLGLLCL